MTTTVHKCGMHCQRNSAATTTTTAAATSATTTHGNEIPKVVTPNFRYIFCNMKKNIQF